MLSDLCLRLRALFKRSAIEHELEDELRCHVDRQIESYVKAGMNRGDAKRRVQLEFGGLDQVKEEYRDALGVRLLNDLWRDACYAVRTLRRSPGFAATAVISIALGVGANTIVFSVVNALVLKPLPITDPDRVVFVQRVGSFVSHSFPFYRDLRERNVSFESLAGYRITMMEVEADRSATHEWGYLATGNYFDLLGVTPAAGRFFHQSDVSFIDRCRVRPYSPSVLTETVVLATIGGAVGVVAAAIATRGLSAWQLPIALPVQLDVDVHPDARVFAFAFLISLLAGVAFGVAPARQAATTDPNAALKSVDGTRPGRWPVRDVFVSQQVVGPIQTREEGGSARRSFFRAAAFTPTR